MGIEKISEKKLQRVSFVTAETHYWCERDLGRAELFYWKMSESCLSEICNNISDENECSLLLSYGKSGATRSQGTNIPRAVTIASPVWSFRVWDVHLAWMDVSSTMEHLLLQLQPSAFLLFSSLPLRSFLLSPMFSALSSMPIPCCWRILTDCLENIVFCIYKGGVCSSYPSEDIDSQASARTVFVLAKLNNGTTYVFLYTVPPLCGIQIMQSSRSWQYKFHQCEKDLVRRSSQVLKIQQIYIVYCHFSG